MFCVGVYDFGIGEFKGAGVEPKGDGALVVGVDSATTLIGHVGDSGRGRQGGYTGIGGGGANEGDLGV